MDILTLILIVVAVLALSGWGYGYYSAPRPVAADVAAAPVGWATPIGVIGMLAVIAVLILLLTGWRPLGPVW